MTDHSGAPDAKAFVRPLPSKPDLEKQKKLAKALAREVWRGKSQALARVSALHPSPPPPEAFTLSDAQLVVARGYGFASWAKLKHKIESLTRTPVAQFVAAVKAGDVAGAKALLDAHPDVAAQINAPLFDFKQMAVHAAGGNLAMLDMLLAHGADINVTSQWEKGGFSLLETATPERAEALMARGARVNVFAAAHLGFADDLMKLVTDEPGLVDAKGGDGKRPLHYARTVEIGRFLLDHGAEIDALDDDHSSTPAQHLIGSNVEVARFLVARGGRSDLLLAAALGDADLVRRHLDENPDAISMRVSQDWFPMIDTAPNGGHIYQWTLGFHVSAFDIARQRAHQAVLDVLASRAPPAERLADALWRGDPHAADALLAADGDLVRKAPPHVTRLVADAARNNNTGPVRMMLRRGFPVTAVGQHGANLLHWAAFHGNPAMMEEVLKCGPELEARDRDFKSTPMGWVLHGALHHWRGLSTAQHEACARLLLAAGARVDEAALPTGHDALDGVLRAHFRRK
jgi:ankyrin repeat protein